MKKKIEPLSTYKLAQADEHVCVNKTTQFFFFYISHASPFTDIREQANSDGNEKEAIILPIVGMCAHVGIMYNSRYVHQFYLYKWNVY